MTRVPGQYYSGAGLGGGRIVATKEVYLIKNAAEDRVGEEDLADYRDRGNRDWHAIRNPPLI